MVEYISGSKFRMPFKVGKENSVVVGAHHQGKTYLAANLLARSVLGLYPLWVWDYHGKLYNELSKKNLTPAQRQTLGYKYWIHSVPQTKIRETTFFLPSDKSQERFDEFCNLVLRKSDMHVMIDEAHNYSSPHRIGVPYARLVRDAGNQNISYTAIFQRPAENHKSILSNATHIFVFHLPLPNDAFYLRQWVGPEVDVLLQPHLRKYHKEEPELPQYSFIYKDTRKTNAVIVKGGLR